MAIDEKRFGDLCDSVARIDERTTNTATAVHDLGDKVDEVRQAVPVLETRLDAVETDTRNQWTGLNKTNRRIDAVKKPGRISAIVAGSITTIGGAIIALIAFWEKIQSLFTPAAGK